MRLMLPDRKLSSALDLFLGILRRELGARLISVILYGSIVFDDLAPGYGDLDFLAVVDGDLSEDDRARLIEARKPLRSGEHGLLATMIEGAFLPRRMLDPAVTGSALWWGTSGERPWNRSKLGWFVLHVIRERGLVIYGEDVRAEIPPASRENLFEDLKTACRALPAHDLAGDLHCIDWLLTAARMLLWLEEDRLSSKSEAADWGSSHAKGAWRELLPMAKQMRLDPPLADSESGRQWLSSLDAPIRDAWREVEEELRLAHRSGVV